jgi:hypothetical protein
MKKTLIITAVLMSFCSSSIFGQKLISDKISLKNDKNRKESAGLMINPVYWGKINVNSYIYSKSNRYSRIDVLNDAVLAKQYSELDISKVKDNVDVPETKKKSILLGSILSVIVPGAGEFYAKSYVKAAIFFGVELLSWGAFAMYQIKGDNQTDKFQSYADKYWSVRQYAGWLVSEGFQGAGSIDPNEPNLDILRLQIMECERQNFSHTMPEYGSQQFYELIGKYQNFQAGWTNLAHMPTREPGPYWYETYKDQVFIDYSNERQKANDYYNYAKTGIIVVVLNHILSAADAAWSVDMFNKQVKVETGFEIKRYRSPYTLEVGNMPVFNMRVSF